jgi:preprotein translocase subunit SecA
MLASILRKFFGSANDRVVKKYTKVAKQIGVLEAEMAALTDAQLQAKTLEFRERLSKGETLDSLLVEAFAVVREASKRTLGLRPHDVQLVGGMVLHNGMLAEMKTGEGKTLVATLPVYLNALAGKGVHVVTVNDYLAKRDSAWMGHIYEFLGLKVGCIVHELSDSQRRQAYNADVTYGTNHEFGFDYLRDNMKFRLSDMVMRDFNYAIVDEVDNILIDEARTPLIISGPAEDSSDLYTKVNDLMPSLTAADYEKDEKQRNITLTEAGVERLEGLLFERQIIKGSGLYDVQNISVVHHVNAALRAHFMFAREVDYIVRDGEVVIIDEFTGRMMEGRRYSEGLHQAIEAKEGVKIENENQTLASITYQNFFRLYGKLSGMSGSAITEASEFEEIYNLRTVEVPPNVPVTRIDHDDEVYLTGGEKYKAVIDQIKQCRARMQPVLVGTVSIEKSEFLADLLKKEKIPHQVLNARYHEQEALIIADAGCPGAVTIATNMAGRGTDIKLGGNPEMTIAREMQTPEGAERDKRIAKIKADVEVGQEKAKQAGGLFVIGTERHESRRIDNQLRGRSGRQGDAGASRFYVSLEDDLMRIFGSERLDSMLRKLGVQEGEAISHTWISKALERAQQKVEARNFDVRKHLLRYDDVMNDQRKVIYEQRRELMAAESVQEMVQEICQEVVETVVQGHVPENILPDLWNIEGLHTECMRLFDLNLPLAEWIQEDGISQMDVLTRIQKQVAEHLAKKDDVYGADMMRNAEKTLLLRMLDQCWKEHLLSLDHLRQGINLRSYAQSNPLNEYKREAFNLFQGMMLRLKTEFLAVLSHFQLELPQGLTLEQLLNPDIDFDSLNEIEEAWNPDEFREKPKKKSKKVEKPVFDQTNPATWGRVLRNAECPCGSGKKYKQCHGAL